MYDTGSSWLWIPETGCSGCPNSNRFDSATSTSYSTDNVAKDLYYGKGQASGIIATDDVTIDETDLFNMNFVTVSSASDLDGTQADGIVGLTPTSTDDADLMVEKMTESGIIDSNQFTVYIGKDGVDSSYIEVAQTLMT